MNNYQKVSLGIAIIGLIISVYYLISIEKRINKLEK